METALPLSSLVPLIAAVNAALLGAMTLGRSLTRSSSALRFGTATLLVVAGVLTTISLDHAGMAYPLVDLGVLESFLTLLAGPLTLGLVLALLEKSIAPWWLFGPAGLYATGVGVSLGFHHPIFAVPSLVLVQLLHTAVGWYAYARRSVDTGPGNSTLVLGILVTVTFVHCAQLIRMAGSDTAAMANLVPSVMTLLLLGFTTMLTWSGGPAALARLGRRKAVGNRNRLIINQLCRQMASDQLFLNREFRLADAARAVGVPANALSAAVNAYTGKSFRQLVAHERVAYAKELLRSQEEARTSIDAIALMSGFHSRSAFYRAFREETGTSPAIYRDAQQPK